jgi:hypothetical protein
METNDKGGNPKGPIYEEHRVEPAGEGFVRTLEGFIPLVADKKLEVVKDMLGRLERQNENRPHILKHLELIEGAWQNVAYAFKVTHEKLNEIYELELRLLKDEY